MNFEKSESKICFFAFVIWKWNIQRDVSHCAHFSAREQAQVFSCNSGHDLEWNPRHDPMTTNQQTCMCEHYNHHHLLDGDTGVVVAQTKTTCLAKEYPFCTNVRLQESEKGEMGRGCCRHPCCHTQSFFFPPGRQQCKTNASCPCSQGKTIFSWKKHQCWWCDDSFCCKSSDCLNTSFEKNGFGRNNCFCFLWSLKNACPFVGTSKSKDWSKSHSTTWLPAATWIHEIQWKACCFRAQIPGRWNISFLLHLQQHQHVGKLQQGLHFCVGKVSCWIQKWGACLGQLCSQSMREHLDKQVWVGTCPSKVQANSSPWL